MAEHSKQHQPPASVEHPMPSIVNADRVIDDLYGGNPKQRIAKQRIFDAAAQASIAPDVMYYFTHLPDQEYTRDELINHLNRIVRERGREPEVGLFGVGPGAAEAARERKPQG